MTLQELCGMGWGLCLDLLHVSDSDASDNLGQNLRINGRSKNSLHPASTPKALATSAYSLKFIDRGKSHTELTLVGKTYSLPTLDGRR